MIRCPSCGTDLLDAARSCSRCGAASPVAARDRSGPGDETEALAIGEQASSRRHPTVSRISVVSSADEGRFLPGTLVAGRYRIIGLLGRGGMGEVYRATDLTLAQSVALKFLPEEAASNTRVLERFHNEIRIARQVSHPNVCRVYDIGEAESMPFLSMEYIDGEDLACLLGRIGRLPSDKALQIARKVCAGLAAAHERGVIHRDLKPHNVMLDKRGEPVITDFGLAAAADRLEGGEAKNGTPAYMAPEQLRGDSVTAKSDIYSLGLILYELFTGRRAFEAESLADLIRAQETSRPPSITSIASDVDPAVERVILRCLHPDPMQRPATALAVAAALPGGDPLAAALAAGETPSPELVAASGKTEGFALRYAVPCLVFVLAGLIAFPFVALSGSMLSYAPVDLPPPVLDQKAAEIAAAFGYPAALDSKGGFVFEEDLMSWFEHSRPGAKDWRALFHAESPFDYVYRQSPRYLLSPPDGVITDNRPPLNLPGMVRVGLDSRARLRGFEGIVPRTGGKSSTGVPDVAAVFRAAGFDLAQFHEAPPEWVPPLAFDSRKAWSGPHPNLPGMNITVETAFWGDQLTSFRIRWPWTKAPSAAAEEWNYRDVAFGVFSTVFLATGLFCALFFSWRNIKLGRGDRSGAFRIAVFGFALWIIATIAGLHMAPNLDLVGYVFENAGVGLLVVAIAYVAYVALEPAVRARWPHSLITWNRLLAGRIGDPRLGSHILVGATIGLAVIYVFVWRTHWRMAHGGRPEDPNLQALSGVRSLIELQVNTLFSAIIAGIVVFFLLCGLRALVRRDWIAATAAAVLMTLQEGNIRHSTNLWIDVPIFVAVYGVFTFVLLRMGLVPAIVSIFVINTSGRILLSGSFSAWYNAVAVLEAGIVASIAIYGFWRSQTRPGPGLAQSMLRSRTG